MVFLWNCRHKKVLFMLLLIICTFMWWCLSILGKEIPTLPRKGSPRKNTPPPLDFLEKLILTLHINPLGTQPLVFIIWSLMSGNKVFKITRKTRKRKICTFTFARLSKHCTKFANVELDKGEGGRGKWSEFWEIFHLELFVWTLVHCPY